MINIKKTENEKHLEIYLKMIGKQKADKFELYQLLDLMNIAQDCIYKLAIDKAFSLQGVVKTLKDKYTPTFKEWKQDNYNHWENNLFIKKQEGLRNIEQLQKIYKKEYNL